MGKLQQYFIIFLLIPSFAEIIDFNEYAIAIPGSPFSLGRITFILVGILGFFTQNSIITQSNIAVGLYMIFFGSLVGGLLSDEIELSLSRSIGNLFLLLGAIGFSRIIKFKFIKVSINLFFILLCLYWSNYVYQRILTGGLNFNSYSQLFGENEAINHHVVGFNISIATIFLALNYFYKQNNLKVLGYLVIFNGIFVCFLSETRSNLLIISFCLFVIMLKSKMSFSRLFSITIPLLVGMYFVSSLVASQNEKLFQRFDATDTEYQEKTTGMRFDFIEGFFVAFGNNPLGKGVLGTQIGYGNIESTMLHNQYLTFILSGGIIAFFGIIILLKEYLNIFFNYRKLALINNDTNYAYLISMMTFLITLITIEQSGLFLFLCFSILVYLSEDYLYSTRPKMKLLSTTLND
jgi:hypothetical protein